MRRRSFLLAVCAVLLISCGQQPDRPAASPGPDADRAVIAVVLEDFANWKDVTFGELEGVLELEPNSEANPEATPERIESLASEISAQLDDEIVSAFIERNRSEVPVTSLFSGLPWARPRPPDARQDPLLGPPAGAKAIGSLTLPGFSADGTKALIQLRHSWSMHDAVVTYVLSNEKGPWQVVARDQAVFL